MKPHTIKRNHSITYLHFLHTKPFNSHTNTKWYIHSDQIYLGSSLQISIAKASINRRQTDTKAPNVKRIEFSNMSVTNNSNAENHSLAF